MTQRWSKLGRIFVQEPTESFRSHSARPVPFVVPGNVLRIFFSARDHEDRMLPSFIDVDASDPLSVLDIGREPLMGIGRSGTFDDSGVTLGSAVRRDGAVHLYYTGWKRRRVVSYEMSIGVAVWDASMDGPPRLERLSEGPVIGQDVDHPILVAGPFVREGDDDLRMWYCNGEEWRFLDTPEPIYGVAEATSRDGVRWTQKASGIVPRRFDGEVISAPWVVQDGGLWEMWFSCRGSESADAKRFRIGLATSADGVSWSRSDDVKGLEVSESGWDSEMMCYPAVIDVKGQQYMFYSGNANGRDGLGVAVRES